RIKIMLACPPLCLKCVAESVECRAVKIDAAGEIFRIKRCEARYLTCTCRAVNPGNQQPLAAFGRQQLDRIGNTGGSTGKHDDAVSLAVERYLIACNLGNEPAEAAGEQQRPRGTGGHRQKTDPAGKPGEHVSRWSPACC